MDAARKYGTPISYDLNFRDSLWKSIGGKAKAQEVNRDIVRKVDVLLGNEEDFSAMLGIAIKGVGEDFAELPIAGYEEMLREVAAAYPNLKLVASTLRTAQTASRNAWGAIALYEDKIVHVPQREIDIFDRVGGGDSFASGLIYGMLAGKGIEWAVQVRRGARRAGHDHSRRHQHGHACRSRTHHQRRLGAHCALSCRATPGSPIALRVLCGIASKLS